MNVAPSTDDWPALLDWAGDVAVRVRDHYRAHAGELTESQAVRGRLQLAALDRALEARDAVGIREAVTAYAAQLDETP